ncbi:MAG TPA: hypothetical protein VL975_00445 [Candidatus Micrarchaeia archaeon]|nr:hypothetical protein [Candidatus Micrarchaeia archaeon]
MLDTRVHVLRNQSLIGFCLFVVSLWLAWQIGGKIALDDLRPLAFLALGIAAFAIAIVILRNWRLGFYFFIVWLLFEDFFRKFLGNGLALFFGKDILAALTYISLYVDVRRGKEKLFRPKFLLPLLLFIWLAAVQVFNTNSPNVLYGLLGMKVYFFYIPLMYVGYSFVRNDEDLRKFLVLNIGLAGVICGLGIVQAIVGNTFLNPKVLAPELRELGDLDKVTPLTNQVFNLPTSVFVSSGRFGYYLILATILIMGTVGFLLLYSTRSRKLAYLVMGIVGAAILFSGSRGSVMLSGISAIAITVGFLWGAPWRMREAHRLVKAIRRVSIGAALGLAAVLLLFPQAAAPRLDFYTETLSPDSSAYEASNRAWDYPIENLELAFTNQNWIWGNGTGTASLGTQYVAKILGTRPPEVWVEEGYGDLIIEMGILAPFLWILWTSVLVIGMWKVLRGLRQTRYFPIAFAIFWYAFLLLFPLTFGGLAAYQNYVGNAYLWLLVGIFYRLPELQETQRFAPVIVKAQRAPRRGFAF